MAQQTTYSANREKDPRSPFYKAPQTAGIVSGIASLPSAAPSVPTKKPDYTGEINRLFGETPYKGSAQSAPRFIYGGAEEHAPANVSASLDTVQGPNIQPDIPTGNEPAPVQAPTSETLPLEPADVMPLPVKAPEPVTKEDKIINPDNLNNAKVTVSALVKAQAPATGVAAATTDASHAKVQSDLQKIAEADDPHKEWENIQKQPFYKDDSFWQGIMGTGLAIMSGKNALEAFQTGSAMADKNDMTKNLQKNRQVLVEQGYSPDSIANAIAKGDPTLLKMKQETAAQQRKAALQNWQYQHDTNREEQLTDAATQRNQQLEDRAYNRETTLAAQEAADKRYAQRQAESEARMKRMIDYRAANKQKEAEQKANSMDFDSRTLNAEKGSGEYKNVVSWTSKTGYFNAAQTDLDQLKAAVAKGDSQAARAAYQQVLFNAARGEIGDNRSLQSADLHDFASDPSVVTKMSNDISLKAGWTPDEKAVAYLEKGIGIGRKTAVENVNRMKEDRIRTLAKTMDKKRATALVNRAWGGGFHDPFNAFDSELTDSDRQGALSGADLGGISIE